MPCLVLCLQRGSNSILDCRIALYVRSELNMCSTNHDYEGRVRIFKTIAYEIFLYLSVYMCVMNHEKIRVNITVDAATLKQAKTKLRLFGGKLSTLFNAYLKDFVDSMEKNYGAENKAIKQKVLELESRVKKLEER